MNYHLLAPAVRHESSHAPRLQPCLARPPAVASRSPAPLMSLLTSLWRWMPLQARQASCWVMAAAERLRCRRAAPSQSHSRLRQLALRTCSAPCWCTPARQAWQSQLVSRSPLLAWCRLRQLGLRSLSPARRSRRCASRCSCRCQACTPLDTLQMMCSSG